MILSSCDNVANSTSELWSSDPDASKSNSRSTLPLRDAAVNVFDARTSLPFASLNVFLVLGFMMTPEMVYSVPTARFS